MITLRVFLILAHCFSSVLFLVGLLPMKRSVREHLKYDSKRIVINGSCLVNDDDSQTPEARMSTSVLNESGRLIFVVLDAFRDSFLFDAKYRTDLRFVHESIRHGHALALRSHVQTPTVTMPRLKALLTGTVPSFFDIIWNLASPELKEDNWLTLISLKLKNRIVFHGDDTWLKLFNPTFFHRSTGVSSFFVSDYTEVDNNVTRQLGYELNQNDWSVLVLHYLGLDHIGHLAGPSSPLISQKLKEMDKILETIFGKMTSNDLLVVVGDHGMSETGSHGGASEAEMHSGVFVACPGGLTSGGYYYEQKIEQVDLVPTISGLLRVPVPANSLGVMNENILRSVGLSEVAVLKLQFANLEQLLGVASVNLPKAVPDLEDLAVHMENLCSVSREEKILLKLNDIHEMNTKLKNIQSELIASVSEYNYGFIFSGLILAIISIVSYCFVCSDVSELLANWRTEIWTIFVNFALAAQIISLASSSFIEEEHFIWYFFWPTFLALFGLTDTICKYSGRRANWLLLLLVFHRICMGWNRAGVKWAHVPKIADFLLSHRSANSMCAIASVFGLCTSKTNETWRKTLWVKLIGACVPLLGFHFCGPELNFFELGQRNIAYLARLNYAIFCVLFFAGFIGFSEALIFAVIMVSRTHNLAILAMLKFVCVILTKVSRKNSRLLNYVVYMLCVCAFFYLGNSNSLGTVDVSAGYVALTDYHPVLVGVQMVLNFFGGPIVVICAFWKESNGHAVPFFKNLFSDFWIFRALGLTFYMILVFTQRHHLFIWSVFVPKLLIDNFLMVVLAVLAVIK